MLNNLKTYMMDSMLRCLLIAVVAVLSVFDCSADDTSFDEYSYIRVLGESEPINVSDADFYINAAKVIFVAGKWDIDEQSPVIRELVDKIIPRMNADSLQLDYMMVRGAASPEGSFSKNIMLSKNRCKVLFDYINARLRFPATPGRYSKSNVAEDYQSLYRMMYAAGDSLATEVKNIYWKYRSEGNYYMMKQELKALHGGKTWWHLYYKYFPQLRAARVMFFFKKYVPKNNGLKDMALRPIEMKSVDTPQPQLKLDTLQPLCITEPFLETGVGEQRLYRRHVLALRTNLLYDFFYMPGYYWAPSPNIQLEFYPKSGHITANASFTCPYWHWWNNYQFWQIRDYMLEGRYYLKGKGQFIGFYGSVYAHVNKYGIGLSKTKGWEGEGFGGGVMLGYVMNLSRNHRWRLEFSLGVGYYQTRYDPYIYGNPLTEQEDGLYYYDYYGDKDSFKERQHVRRWIGPTNVGVHLTFDILYRRIQKRGVSFNRSEKVIMQYPAAEYLSTPQQST